MLFLGMMLGNVLLLDLYNTLGLPTSTTVSMVFGLLGAAVAAALFRIAGDPGTSLQDLSQFINTGKAMVIIAAILLSVALAFVAGTLSCTFSRLIFSFRYAAVFRRWGSRLVRHLAGRNPLFRAVQGVEKLGTDPDLRFGLRRRPRPRDAPRLLGRGVAPPLHFPAHAAQHHAHHDPVGNLLAGPAFAGNDLVNFIGVPLAGYDAWRIAGETGSETMMMGRSKPRPGQLPAAGRLGTDHGADAVLLEKVAARHRDRTVARLAARGRRTLRLDPHFAQSGARDAGDEHDVDRADSGAGSEGHRPAFRAAPCRGALVGPLRHGPRRGQPHRRIDPDRHRHLLQTAAVDDLRGLHGGHGIVARRPLVGAAKALSTASRA